ncbi:MAG: DUF4397 domain-containing protein [Ktedonobacteraceae bacterium]|nr:DUF4397 domain-containing protein [Ktedonobacteraceae bacterium]
MKHRRPLLLLVHRVSLVCGLVALLSILGIQLVAVRAASPSFVRVIHASPYVGSADVFVDGKQLLSSFLFGSITGYVSIPAGPHKVQIALVGKGIGAAVITQTLAVSPGIAYTVAAIGTSPTNVSLEVFKDNNLIVAGKAKVRVYHLAPDAGSVDVATSGHTVLNGIGYQEASSYLSVPAGAYTFDVLAASANATLPLSTTLKANTVTSIFAVGLFQGVPKVELVPAQVSGIPGLPQTGSDPNPVVTSTDAPPMLSWTLGMLALLLLCTSAVTRRLAYAS